MKALILIGNFGMGHVSATVVAKEEIENTFRGAHADVVDLVDYMFPTAKGVMSGTFCIWQFSIAGNDAEQRDKLLYRNTYDRRFFVSNTVL